MIHGVMPRSGTVYVGELLRLHPDLYAYPNEMWEIPFLNLAGQIHDLQSQFLRGYKHNRERIGGNDFLPLFGSTMLAYLHGFMPPDHRLLIKEPTVSHLGAFPLMFPSEQLLLLMRDGRDVVHSTLRTWPDNDFEEICTRWARSTRAMLDYYDLYRTRTPACWLTCYEEVQQDPEGFMREACRRFELDPERYPFEANSRRARDRLVHHVRQGRRRLEQARGRPEEIPPGGPLAELVCEADQNVQEAGWGRADRRRLCGERGLVELVVPNRIAKSAARPPIMSQNVVGPGTLCVGSGMSCTGGPPSKTILDAL